MVLVMPLGGMSHRFNLSKPKWMMTHPDGSYMIQKAIDCMNPRANFKKIILIFTEEALFHHEIRVPDVVRALEDSEWNDMVEYVTLRGGTSSQLETVAKGISDVEGGVFVKDCDNVFSLKSQAIKTQGVVTLKIKPDSDIRRLQQKCFAKTTSEFEIIELVEKKVVSNEIVIGGYSFNCAKSLVDAYNQLSMLNPKSLFLSDAINYLIYHGDEFVTLQATDYEDWGTIHEWKEYCSRFKNIFVDIDGVVFENGSKAMKPIWGDQEPIRKNVEALLKAQKSGYVKLIFATARPESYRGVTERQLLELGFRLDALVMGLNHSQRLLVNDFGGVTSPYPTAVAISVERDSEELSRRLDDFLK